MPPRYGPPIYIYSVSPSQFWGTPTPQSLPPASKPFVPKEGVGVREEEEPVIAKPREAGKPKEDRLKEREAPKIPKVKLPGLPDNLDLDEPKPAPKKEPPVETSKSFDQYIIPTEGTAATPGAEVKVGFFNHSDREITLEVNGEQVKLPSEQYVTLRLKRTFKWAEKGKKETEVAVPPDADGIEIVFRK
jgi:hypothetical protein